MRLYRITALGLGLGATLSVTSVYAQEASQDPRGVAEQDDQGVAEIVVTAQKRAESSQKVGIAIQAFTTERLQQLSVQNSIGMAEFTPGVTVSGNSGGQQSNVSIRGVTQNDYSDVVESPNAVYLDDAYIPFIQGQNFSLLDTERVEIQKGPQGTLFGRNATGGLIQYISRKPSFDGVSGYLNVNVGVLDSPNNPLRFTVETAVGGPLSEKLAVRVAAKWDQQDSYIINKYPQGAIGRLIGTGSDLGGAKTFTGRASILFKPTENFSSLLTVNGGHSKLSVAPFEQWQIIAQQNAAGEHIDTLFAGSNETRLSIAADGSDGGWDPTNSGQFSPGPGRPVPGGDFFGYKPTQPWITSSSFTYDFPGFAKTYGFDLKNVWDISDDITLTSVSDYRNFKKRLFTNTTGGPFAQISQSAATDAWVFSQELRLNGESGPIKWQTGLYYMLYDNFASGGLGILPQSVSLESLSNQRTKSYAAFGQIDWHFAENWTLVAGMRYTKEIKRYKLQQALYAQPDPLLWTQGAPLALLGPHADGSAFVGNSNAPLVTGKFQLEYQPNSDMLIYAGVNRGVKAGGFNAQYAGGRGIPASATPYKEEVLWNYEAGIKSSWFNRKLQVNISSFHYDYRNSQAFLFDGVGGIVINRDSKITGGEITIDARPVRGLDLFAGASYTHARIFKVPLQVGSSIEKTVQPSYTPPFRASGGARYTHDFMSGKLSESINIVYNDAYYYNIRNFTADRFGSSFKVGAGLEWLDPTEHLTLGVNVENLTNRRIPTTGFDLAIVCGCAVVSYQLPRVYNVKVRYSF